MTQKIVIGPVRFNGPTFHTLKGAQNTRKQLSSVPAKTLIGQFVLCLI
jgi:hypothetical protein